MSIFIVNIASRIEIILVDRELHLVFVFKEPDHGKQLAILVVIGVKIAGDVLLEALGEVDVSVLKSNSVCIDALDLSIIHEL